MPRLPKVNKVLVAKVMNHILLDPNTWDQTSYHDHHDTEFCVGDDAPDLSCGTAHCFAGWTQILNTQAGVYTYRMFHTNTHEIARKALGITPVFANTLFSADVELPQLYRMASALVSGEIDAAGFDAEGYNLQGYNREGKYRETIPNMLPLLEVSE